MYRSNGFFCSFDELISVENGNWDCYFRPQVQHLGVSILVFLEPEVGVVVGEGGALEGVIRSERLVGKMYWISILWG